MCPSAKSPGRRRKLRDRRKKTALRSALRATYGEHCHWCGERMRFTGNANVDRFATLEHLIKVAAGGRHTLENCRLACRACNNGHRRPPLTSAPE